MPSHLRRTTCARTTRDSILAAYPNAAGDEILWRGLVYLLFCAAHDRETGRRLAGLDILEWIAGRPIYHSTTRNDVPRRGEDVLIYLRERLLPDLRWSGWVAGERCRLILADGIDPTLRQLVRADLATPIREIKDRVRVIDGTRYDRRAMKREREELHEEAVALYDAAPSATSRYFLERLNDLDARPINGFTKLLAGMDKAKAASLIWEVEREANESDEEYEQREEDVRNGLLRLLRAIEDMPMPFYQPSSRGRTDRVFALNQSVLMLPRALRSILCDGASWNELDLTSCHLAIASAIWGVESLRGFLADDGEAWPSLMRAIGLTDIEAGTEQYDELKDILKRGTYSSVYGMIEPAIKAQVTRALAEAGAAANGSDFASAWLIRDLLDARQERLDAITLNDGAETVTGFRAEISTPDDVDERSVLATIAQGYEAAIMRVTLEYEEQHLAEAAARGEQPDFRVMLWQHDGCSVRWRRKRATHLAEMQRRVAEAAAVYGIPTRLEAKA
jgi:hypothetical protein